MVKLSARSDVLFSGRLIRRMIFGRWGCTASQCPKGFGRYLAAAVGHRPAGLNAILMVHSYLEQGKGATGVVHRNSTGRFCGGRAQWYTHCLDALTMEALAVRDGLAFARDRGVKCLHLETDSQEFVNLWEAGVNQRSRIAPIIRETGELSRCFTSFKCRSCNQVAHTLAKQVSGDNRMEEWQIAPSCVGHLITADYNP